MSNYIVSGYNMSKVGKQSVLVTYIEDNVAKSKDYEIEIQSKAEVNEPQTEVAEPQSEAVAKESNPLLVVVIILAAALAISLVTFPIVIVKVKKAK